MPIINTNPSPILPIYWVMKGRQLIIGIKRAQLITSLSAGGGASGSNYREFAISCTLTQQGIEHVDDIIQMLFQTLALIGREGLNEWRYLEKEPFLNPSSVFKKPHALSILSAT